MWSEKETERERERKKKVRERKREKKKLGFFINIYYIWTIKNLGIFPIWRPQAIA